MAKLNVTVDNELDNVKLESVDKLEKKDKKVKPTKEKKQKEKNANKEGYFKQVRNEMKLVTWPTKKNLFKYSMATIMMVIVLSLFLVGVSAVFDLIYALVQGWIG